VPENVAKLREGRMFDPDATYRHELKFDHAGLPPEQLSAVTTELRNIVADIGFGVPDIRAFMDVARGFDKSWPTDGQFYVMEREGLEAVRKQYGSDASATLKLVDKLVDRDPRVRPFLEATGLASHPSVLLALAARAHEERKRGRL
jgi:hypothetical protein